MRRDQDTSEPSDIPRRFTGWGILAATVVLGLFVFLVVGPTIESKSHLEALEDLDDRDRLERGLRMLCNTSTNIKSLNDQLATKSLEQRNRITEVSQDLGCLDSLEPRYRAEHYLWQGDPSSAVDQAVAQGEAAIEPAIEALEAEGEEVQVVRRRAMRALTALSGRLIRDHRQRIGQRLTPEDSSAAARALRAAIGLSEEASPAEPDAGTDEPEVLDDEEAPRDEDAAADEGVDDFQLGGGLRLRLDGMGGEPAAAPTNPSGDGPLKLKEPSLDTKTVRPEGGVLYEANDGGDTP